MGRMPVLGQIRAGKVDLCARDQMPDVSKDHRGAETVSAIGCQASTSRTQNPPGASWVMANRKNVYSRMTYKKTACPPGTSA